jgi:cardiolipin synthase
VAAYAIGSGADSLLDGLERAAERGRTVVVVVNRFARQPMGVRMRLVNLMRERPWCRVLDFSSPDPEEDLHAKLVVADRTRALVGSANLSRHGLVINHELAVVLEGAAAAEVGRRIDLLLNDHRLVRPVAPPGPGRYRP